MVSAGSYLDGEADVSEENLGIVTDDIVENTFGGESKENNASQEIVDEEEEKECRICRSSDGNVLYMPCRCRGSIKYVHEDCLTAWLNHKGTDKCELCSYVFKFEPIYADNAPERVSTPIMIISGFKFIFRKALPFLARLGLSITLWLIATPLATCILYRAWVHSVPSHIPVSWSWRRVAEEVGSGLAIVAAIVISFLSLLSFTDYMRVRWELLDDIHGNPVQGLEINNNQQPVEHDAPQIQQNQDIRENAAVEQDAQVVVDNDNDDEEPPPLLPRPQIDQDEENEQQEEMNENEDQPNIIEHVPEPVQPQIPQPPPPPPQPPIFPQRHLHHEEEEIELHIAVDELLGLRGPIVNVARNVSWLVVFNAAYLGVFAFVPFAVGSMVSNCFDSRKLRFFGARILAPVLGSIFVDSDSKISHSTSTTSNNASPPTLRLDDLVTMGLGYAAMGLVACAWRAALKSAPSWLRRRAPPRTLRRAERALDAAAAAAKVAALLVLKMVLLPSMLGAGLDRGLTRPGVIALRSTKWHPLSWPQEQNCSLILIRDDISSIEENIHPPLHLDDEKATVSSVTEEELLRNVWDDMNAKRNDTILKEDEMNARELLAVDDEGTPQQQYENHTEELILVKEQQQQEEQQEMKSSNITNTKEPEFSSISGLVAAAQLLGGGWLGCALARWVLGITFMLVVTVAVLQLREVLHPSILARAVRPHEPRPDLLATLLAEPAKAHARRLATSLAIYGALLILAVSVPAAALSALCSMRQQENDTCYLFVARFSYVAARVQIPIELVLFHLALLALLERLKTKLREAQHGWLRFSCKKLDLEHFLLPMPDVSTFNDRSPLFRWAWGDEQPGPVELALEARAPPRDGHLGIRLTILGLASWLAIVLAALLLGVGPLLLGRFLIELLRFPSSHDPLNLAAGWAALVFLFSSHLDDEEQIDEAAVERNLAAAPPQVAEILPRVQHNVDENEEATHRRKWRRGPVALLDDDVADASSVNLYGLALVFCVLWFGVAPLSLGCMYDVLVVASRQEWADWEYGLPPLDYVRDWFLGICVLNGLVIVAAREYQHNEDDENEPETRWMAACARFVNGVSKYVRGHSLASCFDPDFVYRLALPIIIDVAETATEAAVPTWAGLLAGRALLGAASNDTFAPTGAQLLILFRYALVGTFLATASLHLIEPIKNWFNYVHAGIRDSQYLVGSRLQNLQDDNIGRASST
uniref:RING-type E3 ubiquitin transferase n=1 Tax=Aureoumbra lagunensis TaxID=44058 RepID=A0A7S3NME6_9STRA|mmetsp:Transcript_1803/g.2406  ORF Transcript_1803/g.2406 Transcript_1803/m.2406 type:complete len:1215 (-) Transcript_1803:1576-5220(-)